MFLLVVTPSSTFTKLCASKILSFATTSIGAFFLAFASNEFFAWDQNGTSTALVKDLSEAFDCLPHDLLIAKVHAYGCDFPSLKLLNSYLRNRHQFVKINNFYSSWAETLFEVPQGSILGPLLFNTFLCDLFFYFSLSKLKM